MKLVMAVFSGLLLHANESNASNDFLPTRYLVAAEKKTATSAAELKKAYGELAGFITNGYVAYRLTYTTVDVDNRPVIASGALFVPDVKKNLPLLTYNHGTYFPSQETNAPSYFKNNNPELGIGKLFSGAGYLVAMPDYIGYGSSKDMKHPYGAYHHIASSGVDMLRAVAEFCTEQSIILSGKNFFSGWSEGAAVALATVKLLEEKHQGFFTPSATVVNAGPYYPSGFVNHIFNAQTPLTYMSTYVWVLQSYNWIYNLQKPNSYYYNEPAASALDEDPEAWVTHDPQKLFTEEFRKNYKMGNEPALESAMKANDLWNWKPASKIVFCHGDKDEYVPLFNSEKAYQAMNAAGADVKLKVFKGHSHSSGAFNFVQEAFITFEGAR